MSGNSLEAGMLQGRVYPDAFNLLFIALFGIEVAVTLNWKNSRLGYWINIVVVRAADIGLIIYVLLPGFVESIIGRYFCLAPGTRHKTVPARCLSSTNECLRGSNR